MHGSLRFVRMCHRCVMRCSLSSSGFSDASFAISRMASMNASSVSRLSVSVGSIISDSWNSSGKYIVGAWNPMSRSRFATCSVVTPADLSRNPSNTNSCLHGPGMGSSYKTFQRFHHIIGRKCGQWSGRGKPVASHRQNIRQSSAKHGVISEPERYFTECAV